jgi:hypothetical protein
MTKEQIAKLKKDNVTEFLKMDRDAGNVIKQLLFELEKKENIYIRLFDAAPKGMTIHYEVLQGDPKEVLNWAETLGFTSYDHEKLEV